MEICIHVLKTITTDEGWVVEVTMYTILMNRLALGAVSIIFGLYIVLVFFNITKDKNVAFINFIQKYPGIKNL